LFIASTTFIGRGERTCKRILEQIFPTSPVITQISIKSCVKDEIYKFYDEVYKKATLDLILVHHEKYIAIRIQDKHHTGAKTSQKDVIQKQDMIDNGVIVVDIHERDAPYLFREKFNYKSVLEVLVPFAKAEVKI